MCDLSPSVTAFLPGICVLHDASRLCSKDPLLKCHLGLYLGSLEGSENVHETFCY
jgi:hypothetical protein